MAKTELQDCFSAAVAGLMNMQQPDTPLVLQTREVVSVDMDACAITSATSSRPVLITSGLGVCLGLIAYNRATKTAALAHITDNTELESVDALLDQIGDGKSMLEIHLTGGQSLGAVDEDDNVHNVIKVLERRTDIHIVSAHVLGDETELGEKMVIDTRTGAMSNQYRLEGRKKLLLEKEIDVGFRMGRGVPLILVYDRDVKLVSTPEIPFKNFRF